MGVGKGYQHSKNEEQLDVAIEQFHEQCPSLSQSFYEYFVLNWLNEGWIVPFTDINRESSEVIWPRFVGLLLIN
jgi:hypothetical protein